MPEDRSKYVVGDPDAEEPDTIDVALELLGLTEAHGQRLYTLAERQYRSVQDQLRWIIDEAYSRMIASGEMITLDDVE